MIWSIMVTQSHSVPHLMLKISDMCLPLLQVCLTTCCVNKQKAFSDFNFVMLHFCWLFSHSNEELSSFLLYATNYCLGYPCCCGGSVFPGSNGIRLSSLIMAQGGFGLCLLECTFSQSSCQVPELFLHNWEGNTLQGPTSFLGGFEYSICMKDCQLAGFRLILTAYSTKQT